MTQALPAPDDVPAFPDDAVEVGRVLGAWGIKGGIRVQPFSKDPEALLAARHWFIQPPESVLAHEKLTPGRPKCFSSPSGGRTPQGGGLGGALKRGTTRFPPVLRIAHSKVHGDSVVATAQELPDRNAAEAMQGARLFIARSNFPKAGIGEYYWIDLIGLEVVNRQGEALGTVSELLDTGAHSVLRMRRPDAVEGASIESSERLIPFVAAFIDDVNLAERRITVDWGLDY